MHLRKKLTIMLLMGAVCLALVIAASYAWLTLSLQPKVDRIDTNIGANGSLEIALLTEQTYADPIQIRTKIGDSAAGLDTLESNQSWGNVIELSDTRYGLGEITLLPARLNVVNKDGELGVSQNLLKHAEFGVDGRMTILSEKAVSAIMGEKKFTYYADRQLYGVRAIGSISSLTAQQTGLAQARTLAKSHTASAARVVKHTWRDQGGSIMEILYGHYALGKDTFTAADVTAIRELANGTLEALNYVDAALRQGVIGIAASQISDEPDFETLSAAVGNTATPLPEILATMGDAVPAEYMAWAVEVEQMQTQAETIVASSLALTNGGSWAEIEPLLTPLLNGEYAYLGSEKLTDGRAFEILGAENELTLAPEAGILARLAAYAGNYSAFCMWTDSVSMELITTDPTPISCLLQVETILKNCKAAAGNWTRANLDDTFGFALDLAFRCNEPSDLLLQTTPTLRVNEDTETPATQGGGSYMRFTSENMEKEQLLELMDTIRIGFLSDRNTLLGVAKLNISNYQEQEEGIYAPLYLYEYALESDGSLSIGARKKEDAALLELPQNSPAIVTVVVWLDGDQVDNSMVSDSGKQSMSGVLNLQFASSADLMPSDQMIKGQ